VRNTDNSTALFTFVSDATLVDGATYPFVLNLTATEATMFLNGQPVTGALTPGTRRSIDDLAVFGRTGNEAGIDVGAHSVAGVVLSSSTIDPALVWDGSAPQDLSLISGGIVKIVGPAADMTTNLGSAGDLTLTGGPLTD
jgi:hypothetical protein